MINLKIYPTLFFDCSKVVRDLLVRPENNNKNISDLCRYEYINVGRENSKSKQISIKLINVLKILWLFISDWSVQARKKIS